MAAMDHADRNDHEPRPAVQESVKQNARVQQKSQEMNSLLHPSSKERTGKDYSRKVGRVLREKAIAIIEATIGRRIVHKYNTTYFEALKDDLERPNLYRWQFTPGVYDDFPRKGLSAWTLQEIKGCNTALDQNLCYVVSVQDDSSNSTPNSRHDRSSADSRVVLGTPERSPVPHNLEEYPDDLAAGLCHDFDLRDPVGHLQQVTERLQDFRHHLEQRERDFRAVIKQQNATIEKLKRDLKARDDVASGMDELLSSLGRLRTENANLKAQIDGLEDQNAKIKGQNNEVKAQIDGLKDQNTKLKEQNNEVRAQNDALRTTKDELKAQHDQLKTRQIDAKQQFSSEKAGLKAENMKLNTKQLVLEKQVYTFQRLYANSKKRLPSCHTCEENLKEVNEFFEATLRNLPDQDCDSYTPTNKALGHIQAHLDENFRLSKTGQNAGAELTGRPTGTIMRQEKNDIFKSFLRDPIDSNDPKVPAKPSSMQAPSSKRKPTEEPQHHDPKRQRNDSKGLNNNSSEPASRNSPSSSFAFASRYPNNNFFMSVSRDQRPTGTHVDIDGKGRDAGKGKPPNQAGAER